MNCAAAHWVAIQFMEEAKRRREIMMRYLRSKWHQFMTATPSNHSKKFQIALKECYETDYWLGLFRDTHMITEDEYKDMFTKCSKIRKLLIASITTAKENS